MTATDLLARCEAMGAVLRADGEHIDIEAREPLPTDLLSALRANKPELLVLLRHRGYRVTHPDRTFQQEAQVIEAVLARDGFCLAWCEVIKDLVAFHRDDVDPAIIPPGFVPYSESELRALFGDDGEKSCSSLRLMHTAKREGPVSPERVVEMSPKTPGQ